MREREREREQWRKIDMQTTVNAEEDNLDGCLASPPCQLAFNKDNNLTDVYVKVDNQFSGSFTFTRSKIVSVAISTRTYL